MEWYHQYFKKIDKTHVKCTQLWQYWINSFISGSRQSHTKNTQWAPHCKIPLFKITKFSNLLNKRSGTISEFCGKKNLDQCFVNIFEQEKLLQLIDWIPCPLYEAKLGIKSINRNNFPCSKIFTKHRSRFFSQISGIVQVLFGRVK